MIFQLSTVHTYRRVFAYRCRLDSERSTDNFPLTLGHLSSIFRASLGDRLEVGRMTLDHATGVRILLPQPLLLWRLSVIGYWLHVGDKKNQVYVPLDTYPE